jgi:hypothetical protein
MDEYRCGWRWTDRQLRETGVTSVDQVPLLCDREEEFCAWLSVRSSAIR